MLQLLYASAVPVTFSTEPPAMLRAEEPPFFAYFEVPHHLRSGGIRRARADIGVARVASIERQVSDDKRRAGVYE